MTYRALTSTRSSSFTCGRQTLTPARLVEAALGMANSTDATWGLYVAEDAAKRLVCTLQQHRGPVHHGVVLNLRGPDAGTIWAAWRDGIEPYLLIMLSDCPVMTADGDEACSEFAGHPGAHSWDLADPVLSPALLAHFGPLLADRARPPNGRVLDAASRFHRPTTNRTPAR